MGRAKDIIVKPISSQDANRITKKYHYSKKVVQNSQLHFGVFLNGRCEGAMQFGPSLDKRKIIGLVEGTKWNEFLELNRMAFSEVLPKNSESRALAIAFRLIKKHYPHIKWIVSFADACLSGDGTIYRAAGFVLTAIKNDPEMWKLPDGQNIMGATLRLSNYTNWLSPYINEAKFWEIRKGKSSSNEVLNKIGAKRLKGFSLRYIYFLDKSYRSKLTVPEIPYSKIEKMGAGMYLGKPRHPEAGGSGSTDAGRFDSDRDAP